jgi:hypothetical protein
VSGWRGFLQAGGARNIFDMFITSNGGTFAHSARTGGAVRKLVLRLVTVAALGAALAGGRADAAPVAPGAIAADLALAEPAQFIHRGKLYCWYPYGWAGAGWYWCGYGTYAGVGWGGSYGWNGWVVPRHYRAARVAPPYRFRSVP